MPSNRQQTDILIVDPTPADYAELRRLASELGVTIGMVSTGRAALQAAGRYQPDLWMVNVHLPDMSGFNVIELLRSRSEDTHVFCISDAYAADDEHRSRRLKAVAYLCKPVQPEWITCWVPSGYKNNLQALARTDFTCREGAG